MSSDAWFQDPKDETETVKMAKTIEGISGDWNMRDKLIDTYGHRKGAGWMGKEAIKREGMRAKLFDKEKSNAAAG